MSSFCLVFVVAKPNLSLYRCQQYKPTVLLPRSAKPAVIANMSARVGSISDNSLGGWYSYRASKTALNQLTKSMAVELGRKRQKVACILLHPGTVDTDLSKPFQGVSGLLQWEH